MNVLGIILARGGSEGLKDKHLRPLCGRPVVMMLPGWRSMLKVPAMARPF